MFLEAIKKFLIITFLVLIASSCGGISWNPNFYISDYENAAIISEEGHVVYADTLEFQSFACLTMEKIQELREILIRARMPKKKKFLLLNKFDKKTKFLK